MVKLKSDELKLNIQINQQMKDIKTSVITKFKSDELKN